MRFLKLLPFVALGLSVVLASAPSVATAQTFINVQQCDSTQLNGHDVSKITFSVFGKPGTSGIAGVRLFIPPYPVPGDTCHVVEAVAPPGWFLSAGVEDGGAYWYSLDAIQLGQTQAGFQVTLSRPSCCVYFSFIDPIGEVMASTDVCFACPFATPANGASWGRVKSLYR